jgi:molybdopterin/thiamine biosynthesis adenylyltransferase/rhodanese-related sulfurtransferase
MNTENNIRYQRQIILKEFGESGQKKLLNAKVLVIGAGGLGCPALQYLSAAGIGTIGIVDFDMVELSNLQRQILYTVEDIGKPKVEIAAKKLNALNPDIKVQIFQSQISNLNALDIIKDFDLVIDGSDNFGTRYMINDACRLLDKPLIYGAVLRFEGQLAVFNLADSTTKVKTNYRDLFPNESSTSAISCNDVGVLGVLPGMIGTMQATEAIKIITGIGKPLTNKLLTYNALNNSFYDLEITSTNASFPISKEEFVKHMYTITCDDSSELSVTEFENLLDQKDLLIVDIREEGELPLVNEFQHLNLPLSKLNENFKSLATYKTIVLFCNSGQRSNQARNFLKNNLPENEILALSGGIIEFKKDLKLI